MIYKDEFNCYHHNLLTQKADEEHGLSQARLV